MGVRKLRKLSPSRPKRALLLHEVIRDDNLANNGEVLKIFGLLIIIFRVGSQIMKQFIPVVVTPVGGHYGTMLEDQKMLR